MRDPYDSNREQRDGRSTVGCDERAFFNSFYRATARGEVVDSMTIGTVTEPESRFHYNASENSIIRALAQRAPVVGLSPTVWRFTQTRRRWSVLDVGSGTGHWVDFYLDVYLAASVTAIEFVPQMTDYLMKKYSDDDRVRILQADIVDDPLPEQSFDVVNAIGVMFHIVEDHRWRQAVTRLLGLLKQDGVLLVGGDFGSDTRDVQFHRIDDFGSWDEHDRSAKPAERVNKRVRSLAQWTELITGSGGEVVDVVRSEHDPAIRTPENDVLVVRRS